MPASGSAPGKMMRVLVTGVEGQLAQALAERAVGCTNAEIVRVGRPILDLEWPDTIERTVARVAPEVIVNAAAYTAVDRAEDEPELAWRINAEAPGILARAARIAGARLIHISTDYVYDGCKPGAYVETDPVAPQCIYGRTKLEGEERVRAEHPGHTILRTAWLYSPFGRNFVRTMLDLARTRDSLTVVADQQGSPTSALDLADAILCIVRHWRNDPSSGTGETYHCAGSGNATWFDLARHVLATSRAAGGPYAEVTPIGSSQWPTRAMRPANSRLDCSKFARDFAWRAPEWHRSVHDVVMRLAVTSAYPAAASP